MNSLCILRDLNRAMMEYEKSFFEMFHINLNEGMVLCCVAEQKISATQIACKIELTNSNCSKILKSVEHKGFVKRCLGEDDKREMYFLLTELGLEVLERIHVTDIDIPKLLQPFFDKECS